MPELPEVETMVRGIRPLMENSMLAAVRKCRCTKKALLLEPSIRQMNQRTRGAIIVRVSRLAKRIVIELSTGDRFVIEPRMTGLMLVDDIPSKEHLRIEWQVCSRKNKIEKRQSVWFWDRRGLGTVRLYRESEFHAHLGQGQLGPDALRMKASHWKEAVRKTRRAIKNVLLDQKVVAGIGNIYASEILHRAEISPMQPANTLSAHDCQKIESATQSILEQAIRYEGSTLSDGTYRNALNQSGGFQNAHQVYARDGELCRNCHTERIVRIVQNQRSTFFCPHCQQ